MQSLLFMEYEGNKDIILKNLVALNLFFSVKCYVKIKEVHDAINWSLIMKHGVFSSRRLALDELFQAW